MKAAKNTPHRPNKAQRSCFTEKSLNKRYSAIAKPTQIHPTTTLAKRVDAKIYMHNVTNLKKDICNFRTKTKGLDF